MRPAIVAIVVLSITIVCGCGSSHVRTVPHDLASAETATLRTEAEWGKSVIVGWLDGIRPPLASAYGGQEFVIKSGLHVLRVSYLEGSWHSTGSPPTLMFEARKGGRYEVRGTRIKEGFWAEFQRSAAMYATASWVPCIVDLDSNEVVAGARLEHAHFETDLENIEYPEDRFSITAEDPAR